VKTNELIVGHEDDPALWTQQVTVADRHRIGKSRSFPFGAHVKLRYRQSDQAVTVTEDNDHIILCCKEKQRAVTPGQIAVVYDGDEVVGSGVIIESK